MTKQILTQQELKKQFHYDEITGIFTRISSSRSDRINEIAGCQHPYGYIHIKVNQSLQQAHRLAWLYMTGEMPENCIDHINGIKHDNRFVNLRLATKIQNNHNRDKNKNNKSGYKGVCWNEYSKKWVAQCSINSKRITIGRYETPELASQAYKSFAQQHHGEFYRE